MDVASRWVFTQLFGFRALEFSVFNVNHGLYSNTELLLRAMDNVYGWDVKIISFKNRLSVSTNCFELNSPTVNLDITSGRMGERCHFIAPHNSHCTDEQANMVVSIQGMCTMMNKGRWWRVVLKFAGDVHSAWMTPVLHKEVTLSVFSRGMSVKVWPAVTSRDMCGYISWWLSSWRLMHAQLHSLIQSTMCRSSAAVVQHTYSTVAWVSSVNCWLYHHIIPHHTSIVEIGGTSEMVE